MIVERQFSRFSPAPSGGQLESIGLMLQFFFRTRQGVGFGIDRQGFLSDSSQRSRDAEEGP
jgi:hypothetical protein